MPLLFSTLDNKISSASQLFPMAENNETDPSQSCHVCIAETHNLEQVHDVGDTCMHII